MAGRRRRRGVSQSNADAAGGDMRSNILKKIYGYYKEALNSLPLEHMPALAPSLLDAGICFGFADPVTSIIANTIHSLPDEYGGRAPGEPEPNGGKKRKRATEASWEARERARERKKVLSNIVAGDAPSTPESRTIAERSVDGLVNFLTCYFRYLTTSDAMHYLFLAQADILVAVYLIEQDRCCRIKDEFDISSEAVKTAIKCTAFSAGINVDAFFAGSFALVSHLDSITHAVTERRGRLSVPHVRRLFGLLQNCLKVKKSDNPMRLAAGLCHPCNRDSSIAKVPSGLIESLRGVLLDRIHCVYLKAVSRIPMKDLRIRYHRSLLKAGYCYGPFSPVSNIIVNTVWYDTAFPAVEETETDMIFSMARIQSRSLDGLIKLILGCIPNMSEHDAMAYLLKNDSQPRKAIQIAKEQGHVTSAWDNGVYKAAADAAYHPQSEAFVDFVSQSLPEAQSSIKSILKASHSLSSSDVLSLSLLLSSSKNNAHRSQEPAVELNKDAMDMISRYKDAFIIEQSFVRGKIEAALQKYEQTKGHRYEFQIICGLNENVGKERWIRDSKRQYSHVNFWANSKDGKTRRLFFAEFSSDEDIENHQSFCYPLKALSTDVRCCYCDFKGTRILHPNKRYCGDSMDFEKIACGEHKLTHADIISHGELMASTVGSLFEEDYIYLDPAHDFNLAQEVNLDARELNYDREDQIRMMQEMHAARTGSQVAR